ncbi:MAG: hypothetical protein M0R66_03495 [Candidatus Omnitrophica bacterium]|nr:hypothetical protein [Candidatus Omnitrophota bacterium]
MRLFSRVFARAVLYLHRDVARDGLTLGRDVMMREFAFHRVPFRALILLDARRRARSIALDE